MSSKSVFCVGALVVRDNTVLAVRQAKGHPLEGLWTFPWGRLEPGESPSAAALRETQEEAGITAQVRGLVGVQEMPEPWSGWNAFVYLCDHVAGVPAPDSWETDASEYLSLTQLESIAESAEPWSLWLMFRALRGEVTVIEPTDTNPYHPSPGFL